MAKLFSLLPAFVMDDFNPSTEDYIMTTFAIDNEPAPVTAENTDANLHAEIGNDLSGWVVGDIAVMQDDGFRDGNKACQVVFNADHGRAGLVFTGSGSSGHTLWTDATSIEDAYQRLLDDNLSP